MHILTRFRIATSVVLSLLLMACGGGGGGTEEGGGNGGSGNGNNVNWPGNLIGERIEFTVTDPGSSGIGAGFTIVYDYDDGGSVRGENPVTGGTYTPDNYTYTANGNRAVIRLNYSYSNGGAGYEEYELTASGNTILQGTYNYQAVVTSGTSSGGTASGNYRIVVPAAVAVALEGAPDLDERESTILSALLREENVDRFVTDYRFGYVALKNDGSVTTFAPDSTVSVYCGNVRCDRPNNLLNPPQGTNFVDIAFYQRAGLALTDTGRYVSWGGENNPGVREVGFSGEEPVSVRSLVQSGSVGESRGILVVTEEGIVREVYCNHPYPLSSCENNNLRHLRPEHTRTFTSVSDPLIAYHLQLATLYYIDQSWNVQLAHTEAAHALHALPTGLPPMKSLAFGSNVIFGLGRDGGLSAWTIEGEYLPVPPEAQNGVVSVAVIPRAGDGVTDHSVAIVKQDGSARLWAYTGDENTLGSVQQPSGIRQAAKVQATFYERFVFLNGTGEPGGNHEEEEDGEPTFNLTGNWSVQVTEDLSACGIDELDVYSETFVVQQNGSALTVTDSLGTYSGSVNDLSLVWSGSYADEDGSGTISVNATFNSSGSTPTISGNSTWTFNDGEGFTCNGSSTFSGQRL